ncbi:MAG: hypothetical protein N2712_01575 [Brevinematales bacterium]|nr:hypothetical protein [Brevinematales bacterium]
MIGIFANGFGETVIANKLANTIFEKYNKKVAIFSLVGDVSVKQGVEIGFTSKNLGSGGKPFDSMSNLINDLKHGVLPELFKFINVIRRQKEIKLALVIGDPFLLSIVKISLRGKPIIVFNSIYKTELAEPHFWFERYFIKKTVDYFIPRDRVTNEYFSKMGVKTIYFGNPMVDAVDVRGIEYRKDVNLKTLLLLPGSRESVYKIIPKLLYIVESVFDKFGFFNVLCPLSRNIKISRLSDVISKHGWEIYSYESRFVLKKNVLEIVASYDAFGDMLMQSDVVLSCSGTATEQSAGYGKPNVMFYDKDIGLSKKWFERQKKMLGDNLKLFERYNISEISQEIIYLFNNYQERKKRGEIGMKMIEGKGSITRISEFVSNLLDD